MTQIGFVARVEQAPAVTDEHTWANHWGSFGQCQYEEAAYNSWTRLTDALRVGCLGHVVNAHVNSPSREIAKYHGA
jgi:hypothetical protein